MANDRKRKRNHKKNKKDPSITVPPSEPKNTQVNEDSEDPPEDAPIDDEPPQDLHDDDSDTEDAPKKKKKKKKQPVPDESNDKKKGKKSIRQIKKEKYLQRLADKEAASKDQLKSQCMSYLSQWKHDKTNWKFMKAKQVWLNKNKFSGSLVPEESWPVLLQYFESAKGNIRATLLEDANKVIKQMDEWTEKQGSAAKEDEVPNETEDSSDTSKPDETAYKRARDIIQCLQE